MTPISLRSLYIITITVFLATLAFAIFYYTSGYDGLANWYLSLGSCFYKNSTWKQDFFTPTVKEAGDKFCSAAAVLSVTGIVYCIVGFRRSTPHFTKSKRSWGWPNLWQLGIIILGAALWIISYVSLPPAYDEIFSAEHIARLHPFQTLSYYMLPNNHVFFNLVNNLTFHFFSDKVVTGRIISLFAYISTLLIMFNWLHGILKGNLFAFLTTIILALQLPTFSFSAQARGYELQLFAGWLCFDSLFHYLTARDIRWLRIHAIGSVLGYALIPTFLYCHLAFVLLSLLWQVSHKEFDFNYLKYLGITAVFVFIFYLPILCFSGLNSLTGNHVVVGSENLHSIIVGLPDSWHRIMSYGFGFLLGDHWINGLIPFIPMLLLFSKDVRNRWLAVFNILLWVVFILLLLKVKKYPFDRNLIIHYSITLALSAYTVYLVINAASTRLRLRSMPRYIYPLLLVLVTFKFILAFRDRANAMTYGNDIKGLYINNIKSINTLPKYTNVAFSDESFYWRYYWRSRGYPITDCNGATAPFYVKRSDEILDSAHSQYRLVGAFADDYEVYTLFQR